MPKTQEILERGGRVLIGNYARQPVVMDRGQGSYVWDTDGKRYLDLFAGFGGCVLGHCHPDLVAAATDQAQRLWHVGNTFYTAPQIELGRAAQPLRLPRQGVLLPQRRRGQRGRLQAGPPARHRQARRSGRRSSR